MLELKGHLQILIKQDIYNFTLLDFEVVCSISFFYLELRVRHHGFEDIEDFQDPMESINLKLNFLTWLLKKNH